MDALNLVGVALYQSGGPLLAVGLTVEDCLDEAETRVEEEPLMDWHGNPITPLTLEAFLHDWSRKGIPARWELPGALYLRRCPQAMQWQVDGVPATYTINEQGEVVG